ncbi:MAG TPA: hypothetical protein VMR50_19735 [Myxococcota bacterium]|nr:hypothetical protein [Myxococcota bacterium]
MRKRWVLTLFAGLGAPALAGETVIATGMIDLGSKQVCNVANVGTKAVLVDGMRLVGFEGGAITTNLQNNCSFPAGISPGLTCSQVTSALDLGTARCEVRLSHGNAKSLRVTLETSALDGTNRATSEGR